MSFKEWFIEGVIKSICERKWNLRSRLAFWAAQRKVDEIMDGKKWYTSKTLWFNFVTGLVGAAGVLAADGSISPAVQAGFATFVTVGNMILRLLTTQPVTK